MSNHNKMDEKKLEAEIAQLMANTMKLQAETAKFNKELRWHEVGMIIAATLAVVAIAKLFL